jgi:hypothetical protein
MTEAESREIVDSVKEIIEKEHTVAASAPPPPISPVCGIAALTLTTG